MATLSLRIKELRKEAGLTGEEFGRLFGVVKSTVSLYENGRSTPDDSIKNEICNYFKVSLDYLMGYTDIKERAFSNESNLSTSREGLNLMGQKIQLLRESRELTQSKMADLLQLNRVIYNRYENDECQPDFKTLKKIADFFGVTTDYLLGRDIPTKTDKQVSPKREKLLNKLENLTDEELLEMEQIADYIKSKKEKNEQAATTA